MWITKKNIALLLLTKYISLVDSYHCSNTTPLEEVPSQGIVPKTHKFFTYQKLISFNDDKSGRDLKSGGLFLMGYLPVSKIKAVSDNKIEIGVGEFYVFLLEIRNVEILDSQDRLKRESKILARFTNSEIIGTYHSHLEEESLHFIRIEGIYKFSGLCSLALSGFVKDLRNLDFKVQDRSRYIDIFSSQEISIGLLSAGVYVGGSDDMKTPNFFQKEMPPLIRISNFNGVATDAILQPYDEQYFMELNQEHDLDFSEDALIRWHDGKVGNQEH